MDQPRFGDSALRLCGAAARLLGWRPQEFWAATPAELTTVLAIPGEAQSALSRNEFNLLMEQDHD